MAPRWLAATALGLVSRALADCDASVHKTCPPGPRWVFPAVLVVLGAVVLAVAVALVRQCQRRRTLPPGRGRLLRHGPRLYGALPQANNSLSPHGGGGVP